MPKTNEWTPAANLSVKKSKQRERNKKHDEQNRITEEARRAEVNLSAVSLKNLSDPTVIMHLNNDLTQALHSMREEQEKQNSPKFVHEGLSEEEQIIKLAQQGVNDLKEVARVAAPSGLVVRFVVGMLKLGAAGAVGVDALMGALNNTSPDKERDFSPPPSSGNVSGSSGPGRSRNSP